MARTRSFDVDQALEKIMIYFWKYGYHATGFRELTTVTGVKTQSLYNAFGSKEQLYYQALKHYVAVTKQLSEQIVQSNKTATEKLQELLIIDWGPLPYPQGCMVVSSISEFDQIDPQLNQVANSLFTDLKTQFINVLQQTKSVLRSDLEIESIASEFLMLHNGIQMALRQQTDRDIINRVISTAVQSIKKE